MKYKCILSFNLHYHESKSHDFAGHILIQDRGCQAPNQFVEACPWVRKVKFKCCPPKKYKTTLEHQKPFRTMSKIHLKL